MRLATRSTPAIVAAMAALLCGFLAPAKVQAEVQAEGQADPAAEEQATVQVEYLEIVTPEVDATCEVLAAQHGVTFSERVPMLGNARTATLTNGGRIGVRAPMRDNEDPVVRPYILVDDIEAAVEAARALGAEIAHPPLAIPGQGTFAIYILGGNQYGLWKN